MQGAWDLAASTAEHSTVQLELVSPEPGLAFQPQRGQRCGEHQKGCLHQHLLPAIRKAVVSRMRNRKADAMFASKDWLLVASASVKHRFI